MALSASGRKDLGKALRGLMCVRDTRRRMCKIHVRGAWTSRTNESREALQSDSSSPFAACYVPSRGSSQAATGTSPSHSRLTWPTVQQKCFVSHSSIFYGLLAINATWHLPGLQLPPRPNGRRSG